MAKSPDEISVTNQKWTFNSWKNLYYIYIYISGYLCVKTNYSLLTLNKFKRWVKIDERIFQALPGSSFCIYVEQWVPGKNLSKVIFIIWHVDRVLNWKNRMRLNNWICRQKSKAYPSFHLTNRTKFDLILRFGELPANLWLILSYLLINQ